MCLALVVDWKELTSEGPTLDMKVKVAGLLVDRPS